MSRRLFHAPPSDDRCVWTVALRGANAGANDVAQCMRAKKDGNLCTQHAKISAKWHCEYCGTGNDQAPPDHTMDCSRPAGRAAQETKP